MQDLENWQSWLFFDSDYKLLLALKYFPIILRLSIERNSFAFLAGQRAMTSKELLAFHALVDSNSTKIGLPCVLCQTCWESVLVFCWVSGAHCHIASLSLSASCSLVAVWNNDSPSKTAGPETQVKIPAACGRRSCCNALAEMQGRSNCYPFYLNLCAHLPAPVWLALSPAGVIPTVL